MLEGIRMWAGRLSKVGEPAIGVKATLVGCHVGPCPVGKHLPVWSYVGAGLGYWKRAAGGAIGWICMHAQQTRKDDHRKPGIELVHDSCIRSEE